MGVNSVLCSAMRHLIGPSAMILAMAMPAHAWQAGTEGVLCTLTHAQDDVDVRLTFDPAVPLYTITLTSPEPWPIAPDFVIVFDGPQPNIIATDRHVLSPDRRSLTVSDRGFGNVLDGLQFNQTATGISGAAARAVSLADAAPEVAAFRACLGAPSA